MDELRVQLDKLIEITKNLAIRCEGEFMARVEILETIVSSLADSIRKNALAGNMLLDQIVDLKGRIDGIQN